jgi:hypothetical protein
LHSLIYQSSLGEYYLSGDSDSDDGDFSDDLGDVDFGIIKFKDPVLRIEDSTVCNVNNFIAAQDTIRDVCGNDSIVVAYKPVLIEGPLSDLKKIDTIFTGQTTNSAYKWKQSCMERRSDAKLHTLQRSCCKPPYYNSLSCYDTSTEGCQVTDEFKLVVLNDAEVFVPTAFTPNGDGLNDYFGPLGKTPGDFSMLIFNRYGEVVFKSSSMKQ